MTIESNYRILVIDDIASIHQDFRKILTPEENLADKRLEEMNANIFDKKKVERNKLPPFTIDSAYQGQEGLEYVKKALAEKKPYAVAFVDVQMPPGEDGVDTIGLMWDMDPAIQIVICTAYAKYSWEDLSERFGDTDRLFILKKPFDNLEVIQLACSLAKKWNLNRSIYEQMANLKKSPASKNPEMEKSFNALKEATKALAEINEKFKKRKTGA